MKNNVCTAFLSMILLSACGEPKDGSLSLGNDNPSGGAYVSTCDQIAPLNALVIGDSISIGYTPYLQDALCGTYNVSHNIGNALNTNYGIDIVDQFIAQGASWDLIIFNYGLHDLKRFNGIPVTEVGDYADNLEVIAIKLQATGARVVFLTTTHITTPGSGDGLATRCECDRPIYNQAAVEFMPGLGVDVIDLGTFSESITHLHKDPTNVHYTNEGSKLMAEFITGEL